MESRVRLQFDDAVDVIEAVCTNISIGGMQVSTAQPRPQGSLVRFELEIEEGAGIRGLGEVVWMRARSQGPGRDPGMGIKFRFIEQRDRQLIFKIVSEHIKERLAHKHPSMEKPAGAVTEALLPPVPDAGGGPVPAEDSWPAEETRRIEERIDLPRHSMPLEDTWSEDPETQTADRAEADWPDVSRDGPSEDEAEDAVLGERRFRGSEFYQPRPARRREFPVIPLVLFLLLVGVVIVYVYWDDLVGPPAPSAETPRAASTLAAAGNEPEPGTPEEAVSPADEAPADEAPADEAPADEAPAGEGPVDPSPVDPAPPLSVSTREPPDAVSPAAPPPEPPEPPPSPPPPKLRPFTEVEKISWTRTPGGVKIEIETNGAIPQERFSHFRLEGDSPREVVKLTGVTRQYSRGATIPVSGSPVSQIRVGYHPGPRELHIVFDMRDRSTRIARLRTEGSKLQVFLE